MKITIETEREILDEDYWEWVTELKRNGVPINGTELKNNKEFIIETDMGYTKAKTIYRVK